MPELLTPQKHQKEAIDQFKKTDSELLYHGLGSGKTFTAIQTGQNNPGSKLVLTPASLQHNFSKELKKFNVSPKDYHLVSYEKYRRAPDRYLSKYKPKMIIADEIHRAQNEDSLTGDSLRYGRTRVKKFIGLSGSIAQNHPAEIGSLMHTITGKPILGRNEKEFRNAFIHERKVGPGLIGRLMGRKPGVVEEAKNLDKFRKITEPYINTFSGSEDYNKHLPKIEEQTKRIEMSKEQQKYYDYSFKQAPAWVRFKVNRNMPTSKQESMKLNAFSLAARQTSNSIKPYGGSSHTPKLDAVLNDIETGIKTDKNFKAVVYSNFLESGLHPLSERLKKHNIPYGMFTGEQTHTDRNLMVSDYNKGKLKALLISPAGGEGLDLKNTKMMGILDQNWNPQKTKQAIGRAARFMSHESLPENERKLKVVQYLSEPRAGLLGKIKRHFNPNAHKIGIDEYMRNRSSEKQKLNDQFTDILKRRA